MISSSLEKEADVTTSLSRSANDSADIFGWMASLSNLCNFSRSSNKLLNGSSSSFTAACWFNWLVLDFLKRLTIVFFDTAFHDDTKCFIAWRILIYGSGLLISTALIQRWTTLFWWLALRLHIKPWAIGWRTDIVFGGRKIRLMFVRSWFQGEQGNCQSEEQPFSFKLERMSRVFLTTLQIKLLSSNFFSSLCTGMGSCFTFSQIFPTFPQLYQRPPCLSFLLYCYCLQNTFLQIGGKF